jgi:hypothetical protein
VSHIDKERAVLEGQRDGAEMAGYVASARLDEALARIAALEAEKDGAYRERNQLVAALARIGLALGWRVGTQRTAIDGWDPEWHPCVYLDAPGVGQLSWHYHELQAALFKGLPVYLWTWDGHSTPDKYERLAKIAADGYLGVGNRVLVFRP